MYRRLFITLGFVCSFAVIGTQTLDAEDGIPSCPSKIEARGPQNDSQWDWDEGKLDIPCFTKIYQISGVVDTDPANLTTQTSPGYTSGSGTMFGGYGSVGWSGEGPAYSGKGFVRLRVFTSDPDLEDMAPVGAVVILKFTDTKAMALLPGDSITVRCRKEYETVAAIAEGEKFTTETRDMAATYELDYCRLAGPIVIAAGS